MAKHRKAMWKTLKEEKPLILVICPPCTAFTVLQEWNFAKMAPERAVRLVMTGLMHLEIAAAVAKWQIRQGRFILFEHPAGARSWHEECIQEILKLPGVCTVVSDQCQFQLNVQGRGLNKKATRLMSNMPEVLEELDQRCDGSHQHVPLLGGLAKDAQKYPPKLCRAVIKGILKHLRRHHDHIQVPQHFLEEEEEDELLDDLGAEEEPLAIDVRRPDISAEEERALNKVHKAVGHPQLGEFIRFLRAARVKAELIR